MRLKIGHQINMEIFGDLDDEAFWPKAIWIDGQRLPDEAAEALVDVLERCTAFRSVIFAEAQERAAELDPGCDITHED